jgi:hypothetical protein
MRMKPERRKDGLIVRELQGELLVYDIERHVAHCLNATAASVFRRCDGLATERQMASGLRAEMQAPIDESWVLLALARLGAANLLEPRSIDAIAEPRRSRREMVRSASRVGLALLPMLVSVPVPAAAQGAATCVLSCAGEPDGQPCGFSNPCTSVCVGGTCV